MEKLVQSVKLKSLSFKNSKSRVLNRRGDSYNFNEAAFLHEYAGGRSSGNSVIKD